MTTTDSSLFDIQTSPGNDGAESGQSAPFHPNMLLVRWEMASRAGNWPAAVVIAKVLIATMPEEPIGWIYYAFAQHQMGQVAEARQSLLVGARKFPRDWRIAYNLACYTAELGDVAGAQNWLDRAVEIGDPATVQSCAATERSLIALRD